jgi:hypothetical protein
MEIVQEIRRLALLVACGFLACATPDSEAEKATVLMSTAIEVVVVLPMNATSAMPEALEDAAPQLWQDLRRYLEAHSVRLKTVAFPTTRAMWLESVRDVRAQDRRAGFAEAARLFVEKLSAHSEFGAVIFPTLFVQGAIVSGRSATWDGAERPVEIDEGEWRGQLEEDTPFGGAVPAASLHVAVLDAQGKVIHERQSGLALLSRIRLTRRPELGVPGFESEAIENPFFDRAATLTSIARALDPYLAPLDPGMIR